MSKDILSRRTFLKVLGGGLLLAGGGWLFSKRSWWTKAGQAVLGQGNGEGMEAGCLRQVITSSSATSRTVMWQSMVEQPEAVIEYGLHEGEQMFTARAESELFRDDGVEMFLHNVRLSNLEPGRKYRYRLTNGQESTAWHTLQTDAGTPFKALIFPDSQSNDYSDWQDIAQGAWQRNPDSSFFINMGDIVDNGEDHKQWQDWFAAVAGMIEDIPVAPLMGNHETYDQQWKVRWPEAYLHHFVLPDNKSRDFAGQYYSFDYGPVHFIMLNTQWDELNEFKPGLVEEQLAWLRADAARSNRRWKIALLHKDVLQYGLHKRPERQEGFSEAGQLFMPVLEELGVDVVLTAHLHTYRNRGHIRDFRRDPLGPLYILTGVAGNVRYPGIWKDHALDERIAPQPETNNYLTLEADDAHLRLQCFLPDGSAIDDVSVEKA